MRQSHEATDGLSRDRRVRGLRGYLLVSPTEAEVRDAAWLIVKDSKGMNETGHAAAVRWARAYLDLDDKVADVRHRRPTGHTHGWAKTKTGAWRCVQDHYSAGIAPETGCGAAA